MIMPAYTTLPESMLAPSQIADKFNVQTFAGLGALGCDCSQTDDGGDCLDPDPCSTGSTDTGTSTSTGSPVLCAGVLYPAGSVCPDSAALPLCSSLTLPPGFVGPMNCDPSSGPPTYTVTVGSSQSSAVYSAQTACSQAGGTFNAATGGCQQSSTTMYLVLGLAALATLLIASR